MVGHHHDRGCRWSTGVAAEDVEQLFSCAEVEAGRGLVEQQQLRIGHHRAGDLHPLLLTIAQVAEGSIREGVESPLRKHATGSAGIDLVVVLVPSPRHRVGGGQDHVEHGLAGRDAAGESGRGESDSRTQFEQVTRAERVIEYVNRAGCRVDHCGSQLQQGRLACAVRTEDDPALIAVDRPRDVVENGGSAAHNGDVGELENAYHASTLSHAREATGGTREAIGVRAETRRCDGCPRRSASSRTRVRRACDPPPPTVEPAPDPR